MLDRGNHSLRWRNSLRVLVALLFAINVPLSVSFASMAAPGVAKGDARAMSCHEPATANAPEGDPADRSATPQHLCCFTACVPMAGTSDATIALALPVGEPLPSLLSVRPTPRIIGVDPPPPRT